MVINKLSLSFVLFMVVLSGCQETSAKYKDVFTKHPIITFSNWVGPEMLKEPMIKHGEIEAVDTRYRSKSCTEQNCFYMSIIFRYFAEDERAGEILDLVTNYDLGRETFLPEELILDENIQADDFRYYCTSLHTDNEIDCYYVGKYNKYYLLQVSWYYLSSEYNTMIKKDKVEITTAIQDLDDYMASLPH